jgi:dolichol-phosphate mannosyltransferase
MSLQLSVIIPLKNEEDNIVALAREVANALDAEQLQWECIWIDDGSTDDSLAKLKELTESDSRHRIVKFAANAGQSAALFAGFQSARAPVLGTLDADRQNDPEDLPRLLKALKDEDVDMVNGYRASRKDSGMRKFVSRIANGARNLITGKTVRDVGCSTRVFKRECTQGLPMFRGMHRFLPTLMKMRGVTMAEEPVNHRPRQEGKTKYTINNRLWVGLLDLFGVWWLRVRSFRYTIEENFDQ